MLRALVIGLSLAASAPRACDLALVLAVDVSGSVDAREYQIQMQGLSDALRDGVVIDALIEQQAMVTLIQWTGASRQRQTIPWVAVGTADDVHRLAEVIGTNRRVWRNYSTAIGEALAVARMAFDAVPHCTRRVIDLSGDGISNEGIAPLTERPALRDRDITVNALAIETDETDLTAYFFENLIIGEGAFVITATGFDDYPDQIRRKLQRETTRPLSFLPDHGGFPAPGRSAVKPVVSRGNE